MLIYNKSSNIKFKIFKKVTKFFSFIVRVSNAHYIYTHLSEAIENRRGVRLAGKSFCFFQVKSKLFFSRRIKKSIRKSCNHLAGDWAGKACRFCFMLCAFLLATTPTFAIRYFTFFKIAVKTVMQLIYRFYQIGLTK